MMVRFSDRRLWLSISVTEARIAPWTVELLNVIENWPSVVSCIPGEIPRIDPLGIEIFESLITILEFGFWIFI